MKDKIKVLKVEPGVNPEVVTISNDLRSLQTAVDGLIEVIYYDDALLICNDEGKFDGSKPNRSIGYDIIFGTFLVVADNGEDFGSLTSEQIKHYTQLFKI